jgi:hypothetical protein
VLLQVQSLAEMGAPVKKQLSLLESTPAELVDDAAEPVDDAAKMEASADDASAAAPKGAPSDAATPKSPSVVPLKART